MAEPLLALRDVDAFYGPVQALFAVSIRVEPGQVVALLGGNASGKSSTIKAALGLAHARTGTVFFAGNNITGLATHKIIDQGLGCIPEGRRVFSAMSVQENLMMGAYPRRREAASTLQRDVDAVMDYFPILAQRRRQLAGSLSGGEQQMLAMGRAWLRRPSLLCIDEPSMGLSPLYVERIYEVLRRWKAEGMTMLMVDQNAHLALALADRAYVLQNGRVQIEGEASALSNDPAVTRTYLGGS